MKISVVIGTYNQKDSLKLVLESFFRQGLPPDIYEIVVVDSSSTDGTDKMIGSLKLNCPLNYIRQQNLGKSAARNRGVKEARGEIIFFTDADMIADPNLLNRHVETHQSHNDVAVEGITFNLKKQLAIEDLNPKHPDVEPYIKQKLKPFSKIKWAYFLSGNLSIQKNTFIEAGGFDENFSAYGWEDIELGYRLRKLPLIYNPQAINYHYHFVTNEDMLKRKYNMGRSAAYFFQKHRNFTIKMFLGMNPLAMGIFYLLKYLPFLRKMIKNQYILEEYQYRLGLFDGLRNLEP
jgi:glycosyltransferase involved in cell wall biosynthesis